MVDLRDAWERILLGLSEKMSRANLITWFKNTAIFGFEDGLLTIGLPREFFLTWHESNSRNSLLEAAQREFPEVQKIEFFVDGSLEEGNHLGTVDVLALFPSEKLKVRKLPGRGEEKIGNEIISKSIDDRFTLRNFVVGRENQLAHAAACAVADSPGGAYNPLFIYGGVGLGKTHLLQGAGNEIRKKFPNKTVVYLTAENFIAEVVDAIQKRKMDRVREKYRKIDILLIDDIQFFAGKSRTQEVFFHLFNDLYDAHKQMIFSSDKPPSELELTEERLKSRFTMGMVVDVHFPDFETRLAISKIKAREAGVMIEDELLNFIAFNVHHSIRELEGVILQTKALIELQKITPTMRSVSDILKKLNKEQKILGYDPEKVEPNFAHSMDDILEGVCDFYSVPKSEVLGSGRKSEYMTPRQVAMYMMKKYLRASLQSIGEYFSGRDHTSVLHSVNKVERKRKTDPQFWREFNTIRKEIGF